MWQWHILIFFSGYIEKEQENEIAFDSWEFWYNSHIGIWMVDSELIVCFFVD